MRVTLILLLMVAGGCATVGKRVGGISNFDTVDPGPQAIYRGAQPTREGITTLRKAGVRTVIDLRNDPEAWEAKAVADADMTYVNIKSTALEADPRVVEEFLTALTEAERPVFIHCRRGRDRTGLEVAVYRLVCQPDKWTRAAALRELRRHGHNWFAFPKIERYIRTFDPKALAAATQPSSKRGAERELSGG